MGSLKYDEQWEKERQAAFEIVRREYPMVELDDEHRRIIDELEQLSDWDTSWDEGEQRLTTHTCALRTIEHKGSFETLSSESTRHNCFAYPAENGAWRVYRYNDAEEHSSWQTSKSGKRYALFNAPQQERRKYEFLSLKELLAGDFSINYLIDGILVEGQPCAAGGPHKSYKTTLTTYMALCLASGQPFLGRPCQRRKVAIMSGESGLPTLKETVQRQLKTIPGEIEDGYFEISKQLPRFDRPLGDLEEELVNLGTQVLVVDPTYLCMNGSSANNNMEMGQQYKAIGGVCERHGITLILVNHSTKQSGRENRPLDLSDLQWSGIAEYARQWLLFSLRKPFEDGRGEAELYLRIGGSAGHSELLHLDVHEGVAPNRTWSLTYKTSAEVKKEIKAMQYATIVDRVRDNMNGEALCKTPIRDASGINPSTFDKYWPKLLEDGVLIEDGAKRGRPTYRLNHDE